MEETIAMTNSNKEQTKQEQASNPSEGSLVKEAREAIDDAKAGLKDMKEDYKDMPSDAKKATAEKSEEGRSWVADKLEETADSVKPESEKEKEREENKTFMDKTQDKVSDLTSRLTGGDDAGKGKDRK